MVELPHELLLIDSEGLKSIRRLSLIFFWGPTNCLIFSLWHFKTLFTMPSNFNNISTPKPNIESPSNSYSRKFKVNNPQIILANFVKALNA